jgi:transposase
MLYAFDREVKVKAYSMEYRRLVAEAYDTCGSSDDVAAEFKCSASWVRRLIQRRRETGSLEPLPPQQPDNRKIREKELSELSELIAQAPDMTLGELADALTTKVSVPTVFRATEKLKLPLKKSPSTRPSRRGPM